jgi:hypothetical protein
MTLGLCLVVGAIDNFYTKITFIYLVEGVIKV